MAELLQVSKSCLKEKVSGNELLHFPTNFLQQNAECKKEISSDWAEDKIKQPLTSKLATAV